MGLGQPGEKTGAGGTIVLRHLAALGQSQDESAVLDLVVCPRDITIKSIKVICGSGFTATASLDVKIDGTSCLTANVSLTADSTAASASLDATKVKIDEDAEISLHAITDAVDGDAAAITCTILYENRDKT